MLSGMPHLLLKGTPHLQARVCGQTEHMFGETPLEEHTKLGGCDPHRMAATWTCWV